MTDEETGANDGPDTTTIALEISEAFLEDLDATWRAEDFPSRSEFVRWALRDAVAHPGLSRGGWKDIAVSEYQLATGEAESYSSDEIRARVNEDADAGE